MYGAERTCMKALKRMLLGHCGVRERKGGPGKREEKSERWYSLEEGDGGGQRWRAKGREGRKRGAECSFKWKLALSLMAGTSNDDPL